MLGTPFDLPSDLPEPIDTGSADHLRGCALPPLSLPASSGPSVRLDQLARSVVFCYPRSGLPGRSPGPAWDAIPGARGCTPQSCGFRDLAADFGALGVSLYGLSTQTTSYQREFAERVHLPFPLLSDAALTLTRALHLPTFHFDIEPFGGGGPSELLQRMAWFIEQGVIRKLWYPVFPPDQNARAVLQWLRDPR